MFRMIIPALLRTHKQLRSIAHYFILNKYYSAIERTSITVFTVFKWLIKILRKALCTDSSYER
jgi:hypothetical protein